MNESKNNRRRFLQTASLGLGAFYLPALSKSPSGVNNSKKKIVCVGGHPDDPESGCGGSLAKFAQAGNNVTIIYLTTGEAGIEGKPHQEAAAVRKQEAMNACKILNAKPVFAGQTDGDTIINNDWVNKMQDLINAEKPDLVFTHWPLDSHKDHQVASLLTIQSWMRTKNKWLLYFFEVCAGEQSLGFHPTDYIDITEVQEQKREAVYCHISQDPGSIYGCGHAAMEDFRGREFGVKAAEAFVRMSGKRVGELSM
jgi:LmbE family N-acetylglucosaminyl deacetylase